MENFFKIFDNLSGHIDFRYKGNRGYKNWIGGLVTLIIFSIIISFSFFLFLNLLGKKSFVTYTAKKYIETGGTLMDQKNLFHYFTLVDKKQNPIDLEKHKDLFSVNSYLSFATKEKIIHYKYDKCLIDDFKGIENFYSKIVKKNYNCLRKMKDLRNNTDSNKDSSNDWKYNLLNFTDSSLKELNSKYNSSLISESNNRYQLNPEFIYPEINAQKFENMRQIKYFNIKITKCLNSTDLPYICKSDSEINEKIGDSFLSLNFIDNLFDVGNYSNPIAKYVNNKSIAIKRNTLSNLYINFFLVNIITNDGLFFDSTSKIDSYGFDFHSEAFTETNQELILKADFWILNNSQIYERSYQKFQNIAAEIGGLYRFLILVGSFINYLFEKYSNFVINTDLIDLVNVGLDDEIVNIKKDPFKNIMNNKKNINNINNSSNQIINENYEPKFNFNDFIIRRDKKKLHDHGHENVRFQSEFIDKKKLKNYYSNNNKIINDGISNNIHETIIPNKITRNIDKITLENQQFKINNPEEIINKGNKNCGFLENDANISDILKSKTINHIKMRNNNQNEDDKNNSNLMNDNSNLIKSVSYQIDNTNKDSNKEKLSLKENNNENFAKKYSKFHTIQNKGIANTPSQLELKDLNIFGNYSEKFKSTDSKNNSNYLRYSISTFKNFICIFFKCNKPNKNILTERLRNLLLDEINFYKLHLDVIKIKKIINDEISIKQIDEIKLNIYSWIDSYHVY